MRLCRLPILLTATGMLCACGSVGDLTPPEGRDLPPAPYGTANRQTAAELIIPAEQTRPGRSDELLKRSERRENDPFDLPPGGEVLEAHGEDQWGDENQRGDEDATEIDPAQPVDTLPE